MGSIFDKAGILDYAPITKNATATLTTAEFMANAFISSTPVASITLTTPTAAQIAADMGDVGINQGFTFIVHNSAASALGVTIAGGTGVTVVGTATTGQNIVSTYLVRRTSTTAFTVQRVTSSVA